MLRPWSGAARAWAEVKRLAGLSRYGAHAALFTLGTELHVAGLTMEETAASRQAGIDELHAAMRLRGLAELPVDCRADTAVLHYIVESERASVLVRVGHTESVVCISPSFGTVAFNGLANEILNGAATTSEDPRSLLGKAFDILLKPIVDKLAGVARVMVAAPGSLHGIPWGVLYDGSQFAIERWCWVRAAAPGVDLLRPPAADIRFAACAATRSAGDFSALGEAAVVESYFAAETFTGRLFVDDDFTLDCVKQQLRKSTILHLATHVAVQPGAACGRWLKTA